MLVCSAPQFPHGIMDPVEEVAKVGGATFSVSTGPNAQTESPLFETLPCCVAAGRALRRPYARGRLFGRISHRFHGKGWLPTRPVRLQGEGRHQHLCRHPQGKACIRFTLHFL